MRMSYGYAYLSGFVIGSRNAVVPVQIHCFKNGNVRHAFVACCHRNIVAHPGACVDLKHLLKPRQVTACKKAWAERQ